MRRWKIELIALATIGAAWLAYLAAVEPIARFAQGHFENAIRHATKDVVTDVASFTICRLHDCAWLLTVAIILAYLQLLIARLLRKFQTTPWVWAVHAGVLFVSINLWLAAATHTGLFWCSVFQGFEGGAENYGPFNVKYHLLKESPHGPKAVIVGNSQANRQFQPQLLNSLLESRLQTADLHWPGSQGYDILLVHRRIEPIQPQIVICYVSEGTFYTGASGESVPLFFRFSDLPDSRHFSSLFSQYSLRKVAYGLLSEALPAYALRDTLSQRVLGKSLTGIKQRQIDDKLGVDLDATARKVASTMKMDSTSDFQKKAFAQFVAECVQQNQKLVIVAGQLNPTLGQLLPPKMRAEMLEFLRGLRNQYPNAVFVDEPPFQSAEEYVDLTHVRPEERKQFTCYFARRLEDLKLIPAAPNPQNQAAASN